MRHSHIVIASHVMLALALTAGPAAAETVGEMESKCAQNYAYACNNAGVAWSEGKDGAPRVDHQRAAAHYRKACALGSGHGCFNLGNVYRLGEGVPVDLETAFGHFVKACDLDEAGGCTELAIMYAQGNPVRSDLGIARTLFEKGCRLGSTAACTNLERMKGMK